MISERVMALRRFEQAHAAYELQLFIGKARMHALLVRAFLAFTAAGPERLGGSFARATKHIGPEAALTDNKPCLEFEEAGGRSA